MALDLPFKANNTAGHASRLVGHSAAGYQLWLLFALIFYTPLPLASNRPWAIALLGALVGILFLLVVWTKRDIGHAWKLAKIPLLVFTAWIALLIFQLIPLPVSWLHALSPRLFFDAGFPSTITIDPYTTRLYLAKTLILAIFFWLLLTLVDSRRKIEWLAKVIVFSGLFQAVLGVVLMATGTSFQLFFVEMDAGRAHGTFVSPNHFAGYMEMTLSVGIGLMIAKLDGSSSANWRQRLHSWMAVLLSGKTMLRLSLIIMVVGLVASRSRMGNSAFFASLLIAGLFTVIVSKYIARNVDEKSAKNKLRATVVFILSLIVLDVVIIGGMVGVEKVVQRIESTNLEMKVKAVNQNNPIVGTPAAPVQSTEESLELRIQVAINSMQIVRDYPWLGTGGGTFFLAFQHYRPFENYGYYDHVHNDYVEIASESGLIGLALLAAIMLHSVRKSVRILVNRPDQLSRGMVFASLMGVVALFIHGLVDFNLQIPANAMMFLILLSIPYLLRRAA